MSKIRLVSYNIDGLPDKLDLADLPWLFKPIAWVYKWLKKTTLVPINDGANRQVKTREISEYLATLNADVIAVQEDFNYHKELMRDLQDYLDSTRTGDISLKNLFAKTEWRPLPRFKADGLNLLTNIGTTLQAGEDIVRWKKSNGYVNSANDKLTHKGFRYYEVTVNSIPIDLYIVHMDADFYKPGDKAPTKDANARKHQLEQLLAYIGKKPSKNPIIIIGDTNSTDKYYWDVNNIRLLDNAGFEEVYGGDDVDRIFYRNNEDSLYEIVDANAYYGKGGLSDHKPLIVDLEVERKKK